MSAFCEHIQQKTQGLNNAVVALVTFRRVYTTLFVQILE